MQVIETKLKFTEPFKQRSSTDYIVLHHADWSKCTVEDIHRSHLQRGFIGIGYHYFVSKDGQIYRGRPHDAVGAQCYGYNDCSLGICAEGDYEDEQMPLEQANAFISLLVELKKIYPQAKIVGHRDLNATACPGKNFLFGAIVEGVKKMGGLQAESWKQKIMEESRKFGLIAGEHDPDDPAPKWFVLAVANRVKSDLEEVKAIFKNIKNVLP